MFAPFSPLVNPAGKHINLFLAQRRLFIRHPHFRVIRSDAPDKFTMLRIPRKNSRLPGFCRVHCLLPEQYAESAVLLYPTMTADAMFVENWFYLRTVVHLLFRPEYQGQANEHPRQSDARQYFIC